MVRRRRRDHLELIISAIALCVFLWLAWTMEGLNFDTVFIALFCTLMLGFVARCARTVLTGR
jgi:hypothetical protein